MLTLHQLAGQGVFTDHPLDGIAGTM